MKRIFNRKIGCFPKTIGNIPLSYLQSLTYEEQLLWFCKNLKEVIDNADTQNSEINSAIDYMKNNIEQTTISVVNELVSEGQIYVNVNLAYNEEDEEITIGGELANGE